MLERGFYIIKEEFFIDIDDPYLKGNKDETRPHYYCFKDKIMNLYWMIPLSSKVEKYRKIMNRFKKKGRRCDIIHIMKLDNSKESVFLIQDMFPIIEKYIKREYTIAGNHLKVTSERAALEIDKKANRVMNMLKKGVRFNPTQPNIQEIINKLLSIT